MPLELVDASKNYELTHSSGAVFTMRHWTVAMQEIVDRECIEQDGKGGFRYLVSKEREIKIRECVQGWTGITSDGKEMDCNAENKAKLPVGVVVWLVKEIDERAGLRITPEEKKN